MKKEYLLVIRGISEALTLDPPSSGMALPELFRLMARSTQQFAAAVGADVTLECRCDTDLRTGRHYELMSVFRNLLNNAVEAAPDGRPAHLQLCAKVEHDMLCCSVEDDCGGIPPERLSQIFLPGFSSKINHETGEFNRGLGLAIVQDLVETQLGGSLSVRSADGHTTFAFTIPCKNLEESHDADLSD